MISSLPLAVHELLCLAVLKLGVSIDVPERTVVAAVSCLAALLNYVKSVVKKALQVSQSNNIRELDTGKRYPL